MREIKLPVGLKTIMEYAIYDCPNLDRVHIPSSVEEIYPRAFSMCDNIESISVDRNNPVYDSRNNKSLRCVIPLAILIDVNVD